MNEKTEEVEWATHWREFEPKMCPFCGCSAITVHEQDKDSKGQPTGKWHCFVRCMFCDCRTSSYGDETFEGAETRALQVWNERKYANREWGE